jgi:predicted nucleic acid binding AN1-type Zn finger protein
MKQALLSSEDTQQYMMRIMGKKERKKMTDTIKYFIDRGDLVETKYYHPYASEINFIYKVISNYIFIYNF